jgi:pimeloyl-ACP methyl ester carboxylesterase
MAELNNLSMREGRFSVKYYRQGSSEDLVFLHSGGGLPTFTPELLELSRRYRVTAPLLPGFGSTGEEHLHEDLRKLIFWGWDLLDELKIDRPILIGHSFGGMMAAEMAATEPGRVKKLVLIAPAGLFLPEQPPLDFFTASPQKLVNGLFHDPNSDVAKAFVTPPSDPEAATEAIVARAKALAMIGRFLWPNGDCGLNERLYRIKAPTLLLWGESDGLIPVSYADAFKKQMTGSNSVTVKKIAGAGHAMFPEQPQQLIEAILGFCSS